jgi:hypothetical protein
MTNITWRKSSYSGADNGQCLEVRDDIPGTVPVRDSKNPTGPTLTIESEAWQAFVERAKNG